MRRSPLLFCAAAFLCAVAAPAQSPTLSTVFPAGAQRGTEVDVTFTGRRISTAQGLFLDDDDLEVVSITPPSKSVNSVTMRIRVAADCRLGGHPLRIRTDTGITNARLFHVGVLPERAERGRNDRPADAEPIPFGVTIDGRISAEDQDWFAVDVPAGATPRIEVEGARLGMSAFDAYLAVHEADGTLLAEVDDTPFGRLDPHCRIAPRDTDTRYLIMVRDATWGGGSTSVYRMHVGDFPRPVAALPSGGRPGETVTLSYRGDGPETTAEVTIPETVRGGFDHFPVDEAGRTAPTPLRLIATGGSMTVETQAATESAGDDVVDAAATESSRQIAVPGTAHGVLSAPGETDTFEFSAKKGDRIVVRAVARGVDSPVDPVLTVAGKSGSADNDDASGQPDSRLDFRVKGDGTYRVSIRDYLGRGGPTFCYALQLFHYAKRAHTRTSLRRDAEWIAVPRGGRMMTVIAGTDVPEGRQLRVLGLPDGVTAQAGRFGNGATSVPLVLEADADAELAGAQIELVFATDEDDETVPANYGDTVALVRVRNNQPLVHRPQRRIPVAVTKTPAFTVTLTPPTDPLVQGGALELDVRLERAEGFGGPVRVKLPWLPPGLTASEASFGTKTTEARIAVSAKTSARVGDWDLAAYGFGTVSGGTLRTSSALTPLQVVKPWVTGRPTKARTERGQDTTLTIALTTKREFAGNARLELLQAPHGISVEPVDIDAKTESVDLPIRVASDAATGRHRLLFRITVPLGGPAEPTAEGSAPRSAAHLIRGAELQIYPRRENDSR